MPTPVGRQCGLAVTGASNDEGELLFRAGLQSFQKMRTRDVTNRRRWRAQLGVCDWEAHRGTLPV